MKKMFKIFNIVFSSSPKFVIFDLIFVFFSNILAFLYVFISSKFYDSLQLSTNHTKILVLLILFFCAIILQQIINLLIDKFDFIISIKVSNYCKFLINKKINEMQIENYNNPKFCDKVDRAYNGANNVDYYFFNTFGLILKDFPFIIMLGVYLFSLRPILLIMPLIMSLPSLFSLLVRSIPQKKINDRIAYLDKKISNYENIISSKEFISDTKMLGTYLYFLHKLKRTLKSRDSIIKRKCLIDFLINLISKVISLLCFGIVIFLLVDSVIKNFLSLGEFAAVFTFIQTFNAIINNIINNRLMAFLENYTSDLHYFISFLNEKEITNGLGSLHTFKSLSIKNVDYKYFNSDVYALKDINITINKGDKIAIVGKNGSGKTTLSKILLGLYVPSKGKVLINNMDIINYNRYAIFDKYSSMFQNYCKYLLSLKENVCISNINDENEIKLKMILNNIDIKYDDIELFPENINTILSKRFDGIDLSGGEWKRIALARTIYKDFEFVVLDEPTSSIDAFEEEKILNIFSNIIRDKTSVIITHRLGLVKLVDNIYVMDNGKIIAQGTHYELLDKCEFYRELYNSQSKWYL